MPHTTGGAAHQILGPPGGGSGSRLGSRPGRVPHAPPHGVLGCPLDTVAQALPGPSPAENPAIILEGAPDDRHDGDREQDLAQAESKHAAVMGPALGYGQGP